MAKTSPKKMPNLSAMDVERFWKKVDKTDGCWIWTAYIDKRGYGQFGVGKTICYAHRISWLIHYGEPSQSLFILHRCDNPTCVNPRHLFSGSQLDNMKDMISKGRADHTKNARGSKVWTSKLTEKDVREIFRLHREESWGQRRLAKLFGVSHPAIGAILRRKVWTHLQIDP